MIPSKFIARNLLFLISVFLLIQMVGCNPSPTEKEPVLNSKLEKLSWLKGIWENRVKTDVLQETWTVGEDSLLYGEAYEIIKDDTVFREKLAILIDKDSVSYVATVPNQNDGQPVWFRIISMTDSGFVCQNTLHDFPQIIRYTLEGSAVLVVKLEGIVDSLPRSQELIMRRAKVRLMP
ncbi:MAG: hypothetical protein IPG90_15410 [Bacteroidetes bacterium]|nr:hypothetical protein [Bacteroidota bacterium]